MLAADLPRGFLVPIYWNLLPPLTAEGPQSAERLAGGLMQRAVTVRCTTDIPRSLKPCARLGMV